MSRRHYDESKKESTRQKVIQKALAMKDYKKFRKYISRNEILPHELTQAIMT